MLKGIGSRIKSLREERELTMDMQGMDNFETSPHKYAISRFISCVI